MNKTVLAVFIATFVGAAPSFAQKSDQQHAHNGGEALQTLGSHSAGDRHVV